MSISQNPVNFPTLPARNMGEVFSSPDFTEKTEMKEGRGEGVLCDPTTMFASRTTRKEFFNASS